MTSKLLSGTPQNSALHIPAWSHKHGTTALHRENVSLLASQTSSNHLEERFVNPLGGNRHLAQKAQKILGAKENFYKAPKLVYTVILWYRFVVQSPPLPWGGTDLTKGGRVQRGGG